MSYLSANDLVAMRAAQTAALPSTCTTMRKSTVADGIGGQTETWATLASNVACRLMPISNSAEQVVESRFAGMELWQLTLPYSTDITHNDRVVIGTVTYEVAGEGSGGAWETAKRVTVARVN